MVDVERKLNISNVNIVKRTFEGEYDISKNDNPITSKYRPSYKFAVSYDVLGYEHNPMIQCTRTKKDANAFVDRLKEIHNVQ